MEFIVAKFERRNKYSSFCCTFFYVLTVFSKHVIFAYVTARGGIGFLVCGRVSRSTDLYTYTSCLYPGNFCHDRGENCWSLERPWPSVIGGAIIDLITGRRQIYVHLMARGMAYNATTVKILPTRAVCLACVRVLSLLDLIKFLFTRHASSLTFETLRLHC